jgi:hypothetical protein
MATQPIEGEEPEDDVLELGEKPEIEQGNSEHDDEPDEETVIELEGDEDEEPAADSAPIRQLREQLKEEKRARAELEQRVAPKPIEVGPEPDLWEDCDGDQDKYKADYRAWLDRSNAADRQTADQSRAQQAQAQENARIHATYQTNAAKLQAQAKIAPEAYKASEDAVVAALPEVVQSIMVKYMPEQAPMLTHILGTRPKKLEEIAGITDPLAQAFALYDLAKGIKVVTKRKSPPAPEERVSGSGPISRTDPAKKLAELEKAAEKSGDRTAIIAFKRQQKERAK